MAKKTKDIGAVVRERLLAARKERGFTQASLSELAGVSSDAVARIESGARVPSLVTLAKLAAALGVRVSDLLVPRQWISDPAH